jgi:GT2 family glycosyltransferase
LGKCLKVINVWDIIITQGFLENILTVIKMTKTYINILNFNGGGEIIKCLNSLIREGKSRKWRGLNLVVIDNGSEDGSVEIIESLVRKNQLISQVKIIKNKTNLGFAAGNNVGIEYALRKGAQAIMLLNQDSVVGKGFLEPLLASDFDIVAPVIKFKRDKKWEYDHGGLVNWWLGRTSHIERQSADHVEREVDYVSGCAMLAKRQVFEEIGLLDEKYFLYFEDADFCLRAGEAGFKIGIQPNSIITHNLKEKEKRPLKQHFNMLKSNLIFINRWVPLVKKPIAYLYLGLLLIKILVNQAQ